MGTGLVGAGSLAVAGTTCAATCTIAGGTEEEGALAIGGRAAGGGATATFPRDGARSVVAVARGASLSGDMAMNTVSPATPAAATAAPVAFRAVFHRRERSRSYACNAARRASAAAFGSVVDCHDARSPNRLDRPARDCLKCSSTGPSNCLRSCRAVRRAPPGGTSPGSGPVFGARSSVIGLPVSTGLLASNSATKSALR